MSDRDQRNVRPTDDSAELEADLARARRMLRTASEQYTRDSVLIAALRRFIMDHAGKVYTLTDCEDLLLLHPLHRGVWVERGSL